VPDGRATVAAAGSRRLGPEAPLERRDALLEPFETGKRDRRNPADNRDDGFNGHRSVLQQHRQTDKESRNPAEGCQRMPVTSHDRIFPDLA
jgi:hypothetical protein